jgi:predicted molibdopterin-dependent oxidoreductase YjgC
MSQNDITIGVTIDNRPFQVQKGITILKAAEQNDIYIPTLCAHAELSPHGGCRMCIVEVEGMRNLPTACTTPIEEGMVIRTHTIQLQAMRMEILQLFMSEHTSSCLICDEKDECKRFMPTIRKAGVTTGCRYCPNDEQCEFQDISEKLGVTEIKYPIYYRGMRVETEDPFYDRDYNLCILCGRCVRMCQEIRTANVLAFKNRGRQTVIGPAYGRTHLEAGCEFCGACVSVCPTGTLREKTRAWEGKPDREIITTCSFCGVGCQVRLQIKGNRIIGSLPAIDPLVNEGQLCVKGRFCGTELVNGPLRLKNPYRMLGETKAEISWEVATDVAAEQLKSCPPEDFGMLVSPNCSNEDLYVAQKFARVVMRSHNIDTVARLFYGHGFNAYTDLMKMSVPLSELQKTSAILCVGLDSRFARSVVGVALRKATKRGAKIITIHPRQHNLTMVADLWLQPRPGEELPLLRRLVELTGHGGKSGRSPFDADREKELSQVAALLTESPSPVILVGSEFLQYDASAEILESVADIARNTKAGVLPLPSHNNLYGSFAMGAYGELLPGGYSVTDSDKRANLATKWSVELQVPNSDWNAVSLSRGAKRKVLYLVGETPVGWQPEAEFIIFQNIYPPDGFCRANLVLPAAAFTECDGSFINGERRIQRVRKAVEPMGGSLPDWQIICRIAQKMNVPGFEFASVEKIREEISQVTGMFGRFEEFARDPQPFTVTGTFHDGKRKPATTAKASDEFPFLLTVSSVEHSHRGFPLSAWVEGSNMLLTEEVLEINPEDAKRAGIARGDEVVIASNHLEKTLSARLVREQPAGTLHASLREYANFNPNPQSVRIRRKTCSG